MCIFFSPHFQILFFFFIADSGGAASHDSLSKIKLEISSMLTLMLFYFAHSIFLKVDKQGSWGVVTTLAEAF